MCFQRNVMFSGLMALAVVVATGPADVLAATGDASKPRRLNVLFVMADDLNCSLGCYGAAGVKSPNIDRLAARGLRFDRAYCNYPVCNASRTSLMSGRRPDTTGVVDNITPTRAVLGDVVMLPEHFRHNGYTARKVGKIYHTGPQFEDERSWDEDVREDSRAKNPANEWITYERGPIKIVNAKDEEVWDGVVATQAVEWLDEMAASDRPFFLAVGFRRPHTPYISTEKYFHQFDPTMFHPLLGPPEHLPRIPRLALTYLLGQQAFPTEKPGEMMAAYHASITFMDAQLGRVLDALDRLQLWDNTVVLFTSDHGYHLGEHGGLWHKMCLFEETARVPLIVAAPECVRGEATSRLAELVDIYPSLCELCDLRLAGGLEGDSFVPLLHDPNSPGKRVAHTVVSRGYERNAAGGSLDPKVMGRSVRTDRWRYTLWPDGTAELYDHHADPHEWNNLAHDEKLGDVVAEHQALLQIRSDGEN